jgi:hypothetical protein
MFLIGLNPASRTPIFLMKVLSCHFPKKQNTKAPLAFGFSLPTIFGKPNVGGRAGWMRPGETNDPGILRTARIAATASRLHTHHECCHTSPAVHQLVFWDWRL